MSILNDNSKELLMDVLTLSQEELHQYCRTYLGCFYDDKQVFEVVGEGMYFAGDVPVLLVAHMDTVHMRQPTLDSIYYDTDKEVMWSPDGIGADCRAGVFNILSTVAKGYRPHIMLTWEEERGGIGATKLCERWGEKSFTADALLVQEYMTEVNFAIQYDRHGYSEAVYYYLDNKPFENYISSFGYNTRIGSYTDICEISPAFGFASVNVAAGYVDEHTKQELLLVDEMMRTQDKVINILEDQIKNPTFYEYKERSYHSKYAYGAYNWEEDDYIDWDKESDYSKAARGKDNIVGEYFEDDFHFETANDLSHDEACYTCATDLVEGQNWSPAFDEYQNLMCKDCRLKYYEESAEVPSEMIWGDLQAKK